MTTEQTKSRRPAPTGVGLSRIRISETAARQIESWVWALADGSLRLWQLPDAIVSLYNLGVLDGRSQREQEVRAAKLDADRLWLRAFGDETRRQYLLDRLDQAAELANRPDVDDVLDEAWQTYLASLDNIREPIRLTSTQHPRKEVA